MTSNVMALDLTRRDSLDTASYFALLAFVGALQISIAAANIILTLMYLGWVALLVSRREHVDVPPFAWPLAVYGILSLISAGFSLHPSVSIVDSKQLVLFLLVPVVYRLARGARALMVINVIVTVGAASALFGIFQYGILEYDHLGRRPQGAMGHYMTYSGLLLLVAGTAVARLLFQREERTWPALVLPALLVALTLTFTRSAWVGACVAIGLLLSLKDFRLLAILPVLAALFFGLAPMRLTDRLYSMFDLRDPTNRDRVAMANAGFEMIRDRPLTGVGPDVVRLVYPEYREAAAVELNNPHLHNVPLQIAAERGLPALAAWVWFIAVVVRELWRRVRSSGPLSVLPAAALAAVAGMLAAGMFEYNFGDSEFLMLFLVLITLPFAAERPEDLAA